MSSTLSPDKKIGFSPINISSYPKPVGEAKKLLTALKSLWNAEGDENSKFKIIDSSGKGFYDRSSEFIVVNRKTGTQYLCEARTNYSGSWTAKDDVVIKGIKNSQNNVASSLGGVFG